MGISVADQSESSSLIALVSNLSGKVRRETLDEREYLVAPLSMIVPGVLNGSKGPLYYPLDEISRNADAWNAIPIVLNHPTDDNGNPCSARSPKVLEKFGMGHVFNVEVNDRLVAEGWFDIKRTKRISPSTYNKLLKGEVEELSTGLFTDNIPVKNRDEAFFNGKSYTHIARNYRPDHLAILPNTRGACSVNDGCGVNVNEASEEDLEPYLDFDELEELEESDLISTNDGVCACGKSKAECAKCNAKIVEVEDFDETPPRSLF